MEFRDFSVELKAAESGVVEGFASTYGNVDRANEVVVMGAFAKSLGENGGRVPLLWQHRQDEPIGIANLTDSIGGLALRAQLDLDVEPGRRAFSALKKGIVGGLSIGYDVVRSTVKDGVRQLLELKVWEVSVVTIPANAEAVITSVKDGSHELESLGSLGANLSELAMELELRSLPRRIRAIASRV